MNTQADSAGALRTSLEACGIPPEAFEGLGDRDPFPLKTLKRHLASCEECQNGTACGSARNLSNVYESGRPFWRIA